MHLYIWSFVCYPPHAVDIKLEGFQGSGIKELDYLCLSRPRSGVKDRVSLNFLLLPSV